jgi:hypothetical protein
MSKSYKGVKGKPESWADSGLVLRDSSAATWHAGVGDI